MGKKWKGEVYKDGELHHTQFPDRENPNDALQDAIDWCEGERGLEACAAEWHLVRNAPGTPVDYWENTGNCITKQED